MRKNKVIGHLYKIADLTMDQKNRMFEIMEKYFGNLIKDVFFNDLAEKEVAIVLEDSITHSIQGFSTVVTMQDTISGHDVVVIFSGDTIIEKGYRGQLAFPKTWLRYVVAVRRHFPKAKIYWLLISKGYRTYQLLPRYFKKFSPHYKFKTPNFEQEIIDHFAQKKFKEFYSKKDGIIYHGKWKDRLKPNVGQINKQVLKNPHIRFFAQKNPTHTQGDELACIADLKASNLKFVPRFLLFLNSVVYLFSRPKWIS